MLKHTPVRVLRVIGVLDGPSPRIPSKISERRNPTPTREFDSNLLLGGYRGPLRSIPGLP